MGNTEGTAKLMKSAAVANCFRNIAGMIKFVL
jgi:hypothetical protein